MAELTPYPMPRFFFRVSWGETEIAFSEVTGLVVETEVIEYRHGNNKEHHKMKMPGMQKFGNITLMLRRSMVLSFTVFHHLK